MSTDSAWSWSISQRRALIAIVGIAWLVLVIRAIYSPVYIGDSPPDSKQPPAAINPNTATEAELSSIPNIGPSRASAIIAYRESFLRANPGKLAFEGPYDLAAIRGIGPATLDKLRQYLTFNTPATPPK